VRCLLRALPLLILGTTGCSEYELQEKEGAASGLDTGLDTAAEAPGPPDIEVTPASVRASAVCGSETRDIEVRNSGGGTLRVRSAEVDGAGWTITGPGLPLRLASGETALFSATGTDGEATLTFKSNDPDEPALAVVLEAFADQAPVVHIDGPADGTVLAEGSEVVLRGVVSDAEDAAEDLGILWTSSADGILSTEPAIVGGGLEIPWPAAGRGPGAHTVSLSATDSCGQTTSEAIDVCQQAISTLDEIDLTDWHFEGVSFWDSSNEWLELTSTDTYVVGSAFETGHLVSGGEIEIDFLFFIGGGSGADGISLTALDTDRYDGVFLGGDGCGIGFGGGLSCTPGPALPGWSIEVDTHHNAEPEGLEPTSAHHVAFYFDGNLSDIAAWAEIPDMEDTGWHSMRVVIAAPHVLVQIDGADLIDTELSGHFDFSAWLGFTAGTGGQTNRHLIDSLEITTAACVE
jgi:hypothetical protein